MNGKYGKGLKPSHPSKLGLGHPTHLLGAVELPREASVELPPAVDQGQSSSCTGNSSAVAICEAMTRAAKLPPGQWVELPSRLFLYFHGRALEGNTNYDDGAALSDIFDGASKLGVPPESAWTFSDDVSKVVAQPSWESYRAAADQRVVSGAWRILSTGAQRVRDVQAAIASGNTVVLGTELDAAFENLGPNDVWPGVTGQVIGGHAVVAHKYRTAPSGLIEIALRSSWTPSFADNGSAWVKAAAIESHNCSDLWVVSLIPTYSAAA